MDYQKILVLIPSRYSSTRFPGKPLAKINGVTLIERVYRNCQNSGTNVYVVTDNDQIEKHVNEFGGNVCRVDDDVNSGTERIFLAYQRFFSKKDYKLVVNVQGDEPLLSGEELRRLVSFHLQSDYDIGTMVERREIFGEDFINPHRVKVIYSENSRRCHYFSRAAIPFSKSAHQLHDNFPRSIEGGNWFLHVGVYSYTVNALEKFAEASSSYYELQEKLEQLRALELGLKIGAVTTNQKLMGVDLPEDITKLEGVLSGQ